MEQPVITPEMIAAYQRQQAKAEQQAQAQLIKELRALAAERGYEIVARPLITGDGCLWANWGVQRADG